MQVVIDDPLTVALRGYSTAPSRVYKNGGPAPTDEYSYDSGTQTVTLNILLSTGSSWKIWL